MKKNLSYIDSVHRDGRIWNIGVMSLTEAEIAELSKAPELK